MIAGNTASQDVVVTENVGETTKMQLGKSPEVEDHIINVLVSNYKYPLASSVREASSNAYDSHIMNNTPDLPFHVRLYKNTTGNYNLEIEDFGLGMDEKDFDFYYMNIGNSSKRGVAGVLGYYGAGAKSWLAFLDSYEIITRKSGIEYKFLIFKGDTRPEKTKIYEKETAESNGVLIRAVIDRWSFSDAKEAIKEQLPYFPNAYIQIEGDNFDYLNAKIFENDLFSWSEIYPDNELHINFGKVRYPIDFKILKISPINLPVGIKINPDGAINPFFNRESLEYTREAKEIILSKIREISNWFINKYNEIAPDEESLLESYEKIPSIDKFVTIADEVFKINQLIPYSDVPVKELKITGISIETPKYYWDKRAKLLDEYETLAYVDNWKWRTKGVKDTLNYSKILTNVKVIEVDEIPKRLVKKFLLEKYNKSYVIFVKKVNQRRLGFKTDVYNSINYRNILNLYKYSKTQWRNLIKEWQFVENEFKSKIINESNVEHTGVFETWLINHKEEQKANRKQYGSSGTHKVLNKQDGEITIGYYRKPKRRSEYSIDKTTYKIRDLSKQPYLTVYESLANLSKYDLKVLARMFPKVKFALIGKNEVKKLPKIKNFKTIQEFMSQLTKPFVKVVTANKVNSVLETYENLVDNDILKNILVALHKDVEILEDYVKEYHCYMDNDVSNSVYEYAKENNIWDREIMEVVNKVEKGLQDYEFISILEEPRSHNAEEVEKYKKFINQMLLFKKLYNNSALPQYELVLKQEEPILEEQLETV